MGRDCQCDTNCTAVRILRSMALPPALCSFFSPLPIIQTSDCCSDFNAVCGIPQGWATTQVVGQSCSNVCDAAELACVDATGQGRSKVIDGSSAAGAFAAANITCSSTSGSDGPEAPFYNTATGACVYNDSPPTTCSATQSVSTNKLLCCCGADGDCIIPG